MQQHHLCFIFKALGRCDKGSKRAVAAWVGRGGNGRGRGAVHSGRRCPARPDGDIRPEAILCTSFGGSRTAMYRQVTCTCQIWIPGWILPHFDVRTISVASKLKKLQIFLYY